MQYFDKARMELGSGIGVTNGLLATEMIFGRVQVGDSGFESRPPPAIDMAGDLDNPGPTYAMLGTSGAALLAETSSCSRTRISITRRSTSRGAFLSAGEKSTATSRVIVEESVLKEFQDRLVALAEGWKLGDPLDGATRVGPVVSEEQLQTVMGYLEIGAQEGKILAGGGRADDLGDGYYVRPTMIGDLAPGSRVVREEIFGPVAATLAVRDYDAAVAMANDTPYGLTSSLFTTDLTRALRFANEVHTGVVKINQESAGLEYQVPFGGMKESSSGTREQGKAAKECFTQWKTVYMDPSP